MRETGYDINSPSLRSISYKRILFVLLPIHFICWNRDIVFTFATQAMPAIRKNTNIIFAKNEVTGERETFKLSSTTWEMFKNVGKRRMVKYILIPPLTTHTLSKEESQELVKQHEEHAQNLLLLARLSKERRSLLDQIEQLPTPLINRIDHQPTFSPPAPPHLHFHQNKKLLWIKEYNKILEPTLDQISPFFIKMSETKIWVENS